MKTLALIPARGGSKRIPGKNKRPFFGKPIISYSIGAALKSALFDEVMVSTDDPEIAEISTSFGAQVPFLRSAAMSDDHAAISDVLGEVLEQYESIGKLFDLICVMYPTAPLITSERIQQGYNLLRDSRYEAVFSVVQYGYPIQRAMTIEDGTLSFIAPEYMKKRSQDLPPAYHDAGQFFWISRQAFLNKRSVFVDTIGVVILPETEVQDIDTVEDWNLAELKYQLLQQQNALPESVKDRGMNTYTILSTNEFVITDYRLVPLRHSDILSIMKWRNEQLDILRQKAALTEQDQQQYYDNAVVPGFVDERPAIMLFSYLEHNRCIGYGGLTNIDWDHKRAELSFLIETERAGKKEQYARDFRHFLHLIKEVAFNQLRFNRLFTETYDIRPDHIGILEENGFHLEGRLRQHIVIRGKFVDSLIHGCMNEDAHA